MKYLGAVLFIIGALVGYSGGHIFKLIKKREPDEFEKVKAKGLGLAVFLAGVIIIIIYMH